MDRIIISKLLIKRAMQGKFSTFGELANAAGISTTTMTKATDSYNWSSNTLHAIAGALGVSPLSLLIEDPTPVNSPLQRGGYASAYVLTKGI